MAGEDLLQLGANVNFPCCLLLRRMLESLLRVHKPVRASVAVLQMSAWGGHMHLLLPFSTSNAVSLGTHTHHAHAHTGKPSVKSVNSCLTPVFAASGCKVTTAEGLPKSKEGGVNPVIGGFAK